MSEYIFVSHSIPTHTEVITFKRHLDGDVLSKIMGEFFREHPQYSDDKHDMIIEPVVIKISRNLK